VFTIEEWASVLTAIRKRRPRPASPALRLATSLATTRADRFPAEPPETKQPPAAPGSPARSVHKQDASYLDVIHDRPGEWNPTDYAYHLTRRARGLPLWFSLSVYGVGAYTDAIETGIRLAKETAAEITTRDHLELIREPDLGIVLFRRRGWSQAQYTQWADQLLHDQVAFIPPSAWEGERVARFAFLHPHTSMDLVREILDRMQ